MEIKVGDKVWLKGKNLSVTNSWKFFFDDMAHSHSNNKSGRWPTN